MDDDFKTYGVEYDAEGRRWMMHIMARSEQDARARLYRAAHSGKVVGELKATIQVPGGNLFMRIARWVRSRADSRRDDA